MCSFLDNLWNCMSLICECFSKYVILKLKKFKGLKSFNIQINTKRKPLITYSYFIILPLFSRLPEHLLCRPSLSRWYYYSGSYKHQETGIYIKFIQLNPNQILVHGICSQGRIISSIILAFRDFVIRWQRMQWNNTILNILQWTWIWANFKR